MWADFLAKPLQGQKFRDMQAFLQNCAKDYEQQHQDEKVDETTEHCFIAGVCWQTYKIHT
jgi:hypothetical protein